MPLPPDYTERVYAGVLGKIIGVYLGRPFEGWTFERIMAELGEINYYVHDRLDKPLLVTDDDISGTFTFLRALADYGCTRDLTPAQIGQSWLNYIIEGRTILWWGGLGNSTEHTAYLRLKRGIAAPRSGSAELNGKVVAEQIGAQIFIDGWAMVAPGDPELAADLARRAASVSHDGEAIYGAQVLAAMQAQAFVESNIDALIDTGLRFIPRDSVIHRLIDDLRGWHAAEPDWRSTRARIATHYGYDTYGGNCHMVPNHALIIHALLHGAGDFQRSLMIVNTCGWDTDCNSGNLGCLLGIRNGLAGIDDGADWRGPVADRLYLPTADGGRAISDAVQESYAIVNLGRALAGQAPLAPKNGARFHFELPGSVQGFLPDASDEVSGTLRLENVAGRSRSGQRSLALHYNNLEPGRVARAATATFIPPEAINMLGYSLLACPTLYPGQTVRVGLVADPGNAGTITCRLYLRHYGTGDLLIRHYGPAVALQPDAAQELVWRVEAMGGAPIAEIGLELSAERHADGSIYLDYLSWDGAPDLLLTRPSEGGTLWRRAWVDGVSHFETHQDEPFRLVQNEGTGLLIQGTSEWTDYRVSATLTPHMALSAGIAARVQGMRRYYALQLGPGQTARLVKALDGETTLAEVDYAWKFGRSYDLSLEVVGCRLRGWIDGELLWEAQDTERPLAGGAVALLCQEGRVAVDAVKVQPAS